MGSWVVFLRSGMTQAVLKWSGMQPEESDWLTMERRQRAITGRTSLRNLVGVMSVGQDDGCKWEIMSKRSGAEIGLNSVSKTGQVAWSRWRFSALKFYRRPLILSAKKFKNISQSWEEDAGKPKGATGFGSWLIVWNKSLELCLLLLIR